jgi:hypothetical protein
VVGNDVEYLAEARFSQPPCQPAMRIGAAEFGVEPAVVDDVIAVRAAGRGLQVRGAIEMADAQVSEIADDGRGIIEGEARMQLDTVGRRPRAGAARAGAWQARRA